MNEAVKMSVSSLMRHGDSKSIYVLFTDQDKSAEFVVPELSSSEGGESTNSCRVLSNKGFSENELEQLKDYLDNERDYIYCIAKEVNPVKAFMG